MAAILSRGLLAKTCIVFCKLARKSNLLQDKCDKTAAILASYPHYAVETSGFQSWKHGGQPTMNVNILAAHHKPFERVFLLFFT